MQQPSHLPPDTEESEAFDVPTQVAILRRAVAEILIPARSTAAHLARVAGDLAVHCVLAQATVGSAELVAWSKRDRELGSVREAVEDALVAVLARLEVAQSRRPSRATIEMQRRKLHGAMARLGMALGAHEQSVLDVEGELGRALSMRHAVSDLQDAMLSEATARSNVPWALLVAHKELSILLERPAVAHGPEAERAELLALHARLVAARRRPRPAAGFSKLYAEITRPSVLDALSRKREVRRHDERALGELAKLLTPRFANHTMAALAADKLAALRGMDSELDGLIAELPFDPTQVLASIARRVRELRACALAS